MSYNYYGSTGEKVIGVGKGLTGDEMSERVLPVIDECSKSRQFRRISSSQRCYIDGFHITWIVLFGNLL